VATEGASTSCPVCGEAFRDAPARCFRCESDLELWWPLDESLRALEGETFPMVGARRPGPAGRRLRRWAGRNVGWLVPAALMAGLAGALWLSLDSTRRPRAGLPDDSSLDTPRAAPSSKPARSVAAPVAATDVAPAVRSATPPGPASRTIRYRVQAGDSLWRIAAALKGDARRWPELLAGGEVTEPGRLRPGQELRLVVESGTE